MSPGIPPAIIEELPVIELICLMLALIRLQGEIAEVDPPSITTKSFLKAARKVGNAYGPPQLPLPDHKLDIVPEERLILLMLYVLVEKRTYDSSEDNTGVVVPIKVNEADTLVIEVPLKANKPYCPPLSAIQ